MTASSGIVLNALVESSIRALAIAAAIWVLLTVVRVRAGALCHAAWTIVLAAMLLLPVFPKWLPALPVTMPQPVAIAPLPEGPGVERPSPTRPAPSRVADRAPRTASAGLPVTDVIPRVTATPALNWPDVFVAIWAAGALLMALRLALGWRRATVLVKSARIEQVDHRNIGPFESERVAAPVVVGFFNARILVPSGWSGWPDAARDAAIVHERAHIRRRDSIVALLSGVNRAIYWFHPLAWALDRRLAVTAEQACDDEAIRASGDRQRYAELLIEMATAVRRHGGRVAWPGIGMAGARGFNARIDRVLSHGIERAMSPMQRFLIVALCVGIVAPGLACQRGVAPLREDPEIAKRLQQQRDYNKEAEAARALTKEQAADLEAVVAKNPDDFAATRKLLIFYSESGKKVLGWNEMVAARRKLLLGIIERHPDWEIAWWPMKQSLDPEGWAQARALWLKHLENPNAPGKVVAAAATFFAISEKPMAEKILLQAIAKDPTGPEPRVIGSTYYPSYAAKLGQLYGRAIIGSDDEMLYNVVRSVSLEEASGPFAQAARRTLEETTNAAVLRQAGWFLKSVADRIDDGVVGDQRVKLPFDVASLSESYLDRAFRLDPDSDASRQLQQSRERSRLGKAHRSVITRALGDRWYEATAEQIAAISDADRLEVLPDLGEHVYLSAENAEYRSDKARYREMLARARTYGEQTIALGEKLKADPRSVPAVFNGHMILGVVELREGNRQKAVEHLNAGADLASPAVFGSLSGIYPSLQSRLTNYLLKEGERETVAAFFDKVSKIPSIQQTDFVESAKAIREGRMPRSYQYSMTPR